MSAHPRSALSLSLLPLVSRASFPRALSSFWLADARCSFTPADATSRNISTVFTSTKKGKNKKRHVTSIKATTPETGVPFHDTTRSAIGQQVLGTLVPSTIKVESVWPFPYTVPYLDGIPLRNISGVWPGTICFGVGLTLSAYLPNQC